MKLGFIGTGKITSSVVTGICRSNLSFNKITLSLPVGSAIVANNYFWLHGRKPFKENKNLSRELLRIRGSFFNN